jgi:transposase
MFSAEKFKQLARKEKDNRVKLRYMAIHHFKLGANRAQIATFLGVARGSVNTWVSNYLNHGLEGLKSKKSTGRPSQLSSEDLRQVKRFVESNAVKPDGGRLIAEDVRQFILTKLNVNYELRNIYRLLKSLGFSWITSRSKHPKQSQESQEAFKKVPSVNDPTHPV